MTRRETDATTRHRQGAEAPRAPRGGVRPLRGLLLTLLALVWLAPATASAESSEYKPDEAGNPLRILAYVVHPVGVTLDYLILRPAYWVGSHDPFKTLFGRTD